MMTKVSTKLRCAENNNLTWKFLLEEDKEIMFLFPFYNYFDQLCDDLFSVLNAIPHCISQSSLFFCISTNLGSTLLNLIKRTLVWEFNLSKKTHSNLTIKNFLLTISTESQLLILFKKYPVLKYLLDRTLNHFKIYVMQLFCRIKSDLYELLQLFDLYDYKLQFFHVLGDAHCLGNKVATITFYHQRNNVVKKIIYKPRDVNLENYFYKFLQYIHANNPSFFLKPLSVLSKNNYGWIEYAHHFSIDEQFAPKYYYNFGLLLGICSTLNGQDLHFENLIASGLNPIVIDLECLFTPPTELNYAEDYFPSIFDTLLVPYPHNKNQYDFSALLNHPYQTSFMQHFEIKGDYLRNVFVERSNANIIPAGNVLVNTSTGLPFSATQFSIEIAAGYVYSMNWVVENKKFVVEFMINNFSNLKSRIIFRPTFIYSKILNESYHPQLLSSFDAYHQHLLRFCENQNKLDQSIYKDELFDLLNGDIPYFSTITNSSLVKNSRGYTVKYASYGSGMEHVLNKINMLNKAYINKMANQLIASLKDRYV